MTDTKEHCRYLIEHVKRVYHDEYDISEELLNSLITDEIQKEFRLVYEQLYFNLKFDTNNELNLVDLTNIADNACLCGFVKKAENNGVVQFCNIHKHLHYEIKDHSFVQKTQQNILQEKKQTLSETNTRQFFKQMINYIYKRIKREIYNTYAQNYFTIPEEFFHNKQGFDRILSGLNQWISAHRDCFKSILIRRTLAQQETVGAHIYFIELFIPQSEDDNYRKELETLHETSFPALETPSRRVS